MAAVSVKRSIAHFLSTERCIPFVLTLSSNPVSWLLLKGGFFLYHYSYVILQRGIERYYRDLTEIQCAIRADDKCFDGMWNFVNLKTVKWLILVYLWISCHG